MAQSKIIFIVGYFGFGNAGDEAILSATLAHFRGRRADLHIIVASGNPEKTAADHGVAAILWTDVAAILNTVQSADLVLIGGGGLFHDYWGSDPDTFLTPRHWGVVYYAGPALLAVLYRKPLMLFGVGAGPLLSAYGRRFTQQAAYGATAITVRDESSKRLFEELGIAADAIRLTADPAFLFDPASTAGIDEILPEGFELRSPVLGVAARRWAFGVDPDFLERELASALDLFLKETGGTVVLAPFQSNSGEREDDRATAARIFGRMRFQERAVIAPEANPDRIYGWLSGCDLVLAMRLHALVFAAMAGVPVVGLNYDPKILELAKRLGVEHFCVDAKDIEAAALVRLLAQALERKSEVSEAIRFAAAILRQEAVENIAVATRLLDLLPAEAAPRLEASDLLRIAQLEKQTKTLVQTLEDERRKHSAEARTLHGEIDALQNGIHKLEQTATELRGHLQYAVGEWEQSKRLNENYAGRLRQEADALRQADAERAALTRDLDYFGTVFQNDLAVYRSQRAWKAMLLCRKAYTLLRRSKFAFLRWAVGLLFGRAGNLDEYDLAFPDIARYIPETARRPILPAGPAVETSVAAADIAPANGLAATLSSAALDNPPQRDRFDVVILAIIDFDFRFQRPQQIAAEFARQGHRVFWISPTRFLPPNSTDVYQALPLRENLWEIHLRSRQPDIYLGELLPEDVETMSACLDALFRDWGISEHALMVQLPFWRRLALEVRSRYASILLYDCMDDWETFENMGTFNVREEKELVHECDVLVVTGTELENKFRAQGLGPVLARNGADYAFFASAPANDLLADMRRPIVGYFGAIADWIDLDLVYEVARSRPQYSFVLIGQVFGRDVSRLESLGNVHLLGNKAYADIPSYLYNFDACLIPFLLNQVTKATDPVKLYEYLSLGKPVVATDMAELRQCGDLLYIAKDAEDFAAKLDLAMAESGPQLKQRRIEFAKANTWTSRVAQISQAVAGAFPVISILIVTHNSARYAGPCLDSILQNTSDPRYEVIVVDNASTDETLEIVSAYAGRDSRIRVIPLAQNLGFAGGNNRAASESGGEYLVFLNIDTMVTGGWLGRLLRHFVRESSIGLLCPVTNFAGNEVKINVSYSGASEMERFARALAAAHDGKRLEIEVAPLYCAMIPRAVWERVGEMDTRFEIGMFEDDDLSLRVRRAGYGIFAAEDTFVHHFGQGSFAKLSTDTYNRIFEANRRRFEEKWQQPWTAHRPRAGVRPAYEEKRFEPEEFVRAGEEAAQARGR